MNDKRIDDLFVLQQNVATDLKQLSQDVSSIANSVSLMVQSNKHHEKRIDGFEKRLDSQGYELKKILDVVNNHNEQLKSLPDLQQKADNSAKFIEHSEKKDKNRTKLTWRIIDIVLRHVTPLIFAAIGAAAIKFGDAISSLFQ